MTTRLACLCLACILATSWAAAARAAPESFNTALPVAEGEFVFREQFILDQSGDDPSGADRDRTAWALVSVLGYGATSDLALFGVVPYVDRSLDITQGGTRRTRSASGLGDISLFGRYTVFRRDWPGRTLRVASFAGLELPTGDDDETDSFGRLPASVQPGSGSWDPFGGVVLSYQTLDFEVDAQASYRANTK
ncbi:MAG: transporter, partial [Proteobacteria bacterium]|nr:transporter [Pseudomonadota bacterium]